MSATITLNDEHFAYINKVAKSRQEAAEAQTRFREVQIESVRAECAAYLFLKPVKWNAIAQEKGGVPDLDDFIDVRAITSAASPLIVLPHDPIQWAFVLVDASRHPTYEILTWAWGAECKKEEFWHGRHEAGAGYFVGQGEPVFHPIGDLVAILRDKQARRCG